MKFVELLEHESTSEFSDFTESENSDDEVDEHAFVDSVCKENDCANSVAYILVPVPG